MRVLIVGASKVGEAVTKYLCQEGHDVVVIDNEAGRIDAITDRFDCNGYTGNGASVELLKKAGAASSKMLIAVTKSDETNILCCAVGKKLGIKHTIATIRKPQYRSEHRFLKTEMGVDSIVNPERMAANEIHKMLKYPDGIEIERFGDGNVFVASITIKKGNMLVGTKLFNFRENAGGDVLVCAINRGGKAVSPKGDTEIKAGDKITVLAVGEVMDAFLNKIGIIEKVIKSVLIVGGSKIGYYLVELMLQSGIKVKLIDKSPERCRELLDSFPRAEVLCGDGTDAELLEKGLAGVDGCVTVTGSDDVNLIISMFAKSFGIERISAEIDNENYNNMIHSSGISHIFSTQDVSMAGVIRNARATAGLGDKDSGNIKWLYTLDEGRVEAVEFEVKESFKYCGKQLMSSDFKLKENVLIATIIRNGETEIANGSSVINAGDKVIVVSADRKITELSDICA